MLALVLSKLDSPSPVPLALTLDKYPVEEYTAAVSAKFYWRFEDEPESSYQYLGQQSIGFPFAVPFDPQGREIRISMIGVSGTGVQSTYDPREGVQTTFTTASPVIYGGDIVTYGGEVVTY